MSAWNKLTSWVDNTMGSTLGWAVNYPVKLTEEVTGLKASEQASIAGALGGASGATNASENGGLLNSLFGNGDGNNSLLGSIFGSGENSLSGILGSVVKGAVGIGTSYFENQQYYKDQTKLNEQTFQHNRALADEAYQRDVAMWNAQNTYNAPAQQMARLQKAGLNPNLVYGSGNVTGNTAGSAPSYPQIQYPSSKAQKLDLVRNVLGIFDEYQSIRNQALQNQRENAMLALKAKQLELSEKREDRNEREAERRFNLLMAQFGFQQQKEEDNTGTVKRVKKKARKLNDDANAGKYDGTWIGGFGKGLFWTKWI